MQYLYFRHAERFVGAEKSVYDPVQNVGRDKAAGAAAVCDHDRRSKQLGADELGCLLIIVTRHGLDEYQTAVFVGPRDLVRLDVQREDIAVGHARVIVQIAVAAVRNGDAAELGPFYEGVIAGGEDYRAAAAYAGRPVRELGAADAYYHVLAVFRLVQRGVGDGIVSHFEGERAVDGGYHYLRGRGDVYAALAAALQADERDLAALRTDLAVLDHQIADLSAAADLKCVGGEGDILLVDHRGVRGDFVRRDAAVAGQRAVSAAEIDESAALDGAGDVQDSVVGHVQLGAAQVVFEARGLQALEILDQDRRAVADLQRRVRAYRELADGLGQIIVIDGLVCMLRAVIIGDADYVAVLVEDRLGAGAAQQEARLRGHDQS